jgi:hypothetical protein
MTYLRILIFNKVWSLYLSNFLAHRTVPQQTVYRSEKYRKINEKRHLDIRTFGIFNANLSDNSKRTVS